MLGLAVTLAVEFQGEHAQVRGHAGLNLKLGPVFARGHRSPWGPVWPARLAAGARPSQIAVSAAPALSLPHTAAMQQLAEDFWNIRAAYRVAGVLDIGTH